MLETVHSNPAARLAAAVHLPLMLKEDWAPDLLPKWVASHPACQTPEPFQEPITKHKVLYERRHQPQQLHMGR
jgi:hypothetical protein